MTIPLTWLDPQKQKAWHGNSYFLPVRPGTVHGIARSSGAVGVTSAAFRGCLLKQRRNIARRLLPVNLASLSCSIYQPEHVSMTNRAVQPTLLWERRGMTCTPPWALPVGLSAQLPSLRSLLMIHKTALQGCQAQARACSRLAVIGISLWLVN